MAQDPSDAEMLSAYGPIRYRHTAWWQYMQFLAGEGWITDKGGIAPQLPERIMQEFITPYAQSYSETVKNRADAGELMGQMVANLMALRIWIPLTAQYELNGRQIFDLSDGLVETLRDTEIKAASCEQLILPYDALFLRFGAQRDIKLPFGDPERPDLEPWEYFDGAFVTRALFDETTGASRLVFGLTTVRSDGTGMRLPGYQMDLQPHEQLLPALKAVDAALARRLRELKAAETVPGGSANWKAICALIAARYQECAALLRAAMPLVLNGLFYLETLDRSSGLEPGRDTSSKLTARWANARPEQRRKIEQRLTSEGYALVHMTGKSVSAPTLRREQGQKNPHWRCRHVRMQRIGPNLTGVKRIIIEPQFINPHGKPTDDVPGHIYVPGPEKPQ